MKHYDTETKPALSALAREMTRPPMGPTHDLPRIKAAVDAAAQAGATPHEIVEHVGGTKRWNQLVRALKKAGLV